VKELPPNDDIRPGLPEGIREVEVDFGREDEPVRNPPGPARGRNRKMEKVFQDQMKEHFQRRMTKDFKYVLSEIVTQARGGCTASQKMLMDRVVPVSKATDLDALAGRHPIIQINVGSMDSKDNSVIEVSAKDNE